MSGRYRIWVRWGSASVLVEGSGGQRCAGWNGRRVDRGVPEFRSGFHEVHEPATVGGWELRAGRRGGAISDVILGREAFPSQLPQRRRAHL